jgi:hypothetical protein
MSKYEPLKRHLLRLEQSEAPMSFAEIEAVLGFRLPPSARKHPPWWSNSVGTHVNAAAWREAGWKTSRVDIPGERVTFVRDAPPTSTASTQWGVAEASEPFALGQLSRGAQRMIEDCMEETGLDRAGAVAALLEAQAAARRRQLLETMPVAHMPAGFDSTAMIREDRDR